MNDEQKPLRLASVGQTVRALAERMTYLPAKLRMHLVKCDRDLTECFVCQLIERRLFGD